ncbi:hypothetical protein OB905_07335 [Halobacteria archaeon AArc-dxtr1]|nr:hypothetical protein [Halobacteria archaeon AArc-dxtr1]
MSIRIGSDGDDEDDGWDEDGDRWGDDDDGWVNNGDGWDNETSGGDDEGADRSWVHRLVIPPDLGGLFVRTALAFFLLTLLSMIALVVVLLIASDEPFVDQPHLEDPITGWVWLLSLTGTAVSMVGYVVWSFWKQRRLRERSLHQQPPNHPETPLYLRPVRALQIAGTDSDELTEYEKRVQKTVTVLVLSLFVGYLPARIALAVLLGV